MNNDAEKRYEIEMRKSQQSLGSILDAVENYLCDENPYEILKAFLLARVDGIKDQDKLALLGFNDADAFYDWVDGLDLGDENMRILILLCEFFIGDGKTTYLLVKRYEKQLENAILNQMSNNYPDLDI